MTIKVKALARKNPQNLKRSVRYYAGKVYQGETSLQSMINQISESTEYSNLVVSNIINEFLELIPALLIDGQIVRLGNLGSFHVTLSSSPSDNSDNFSIGSIKAIKPAFRPSKAFKMKFNLVDVKRIR